VKKLFSLISALITLSLVGIIWLQVSWIKNMIALREDQVKQKIDGVWNTVGTELTQLKSQFTSIPDVDPLGLLPNIGYRGGGTFGINHYNTIGSRLSASEIHDRIRKAFNRAGLPDLDFEYALMVGFLSPFPQIEKQSVNFDRARMDSAANYLTTGYAIISQSGSPGENMSSDEALFLIALDWKSVVLRSLGWSIVLGVLFTAVIVAAFYLTVYTMRRQKKLGDIKNDFINNMTHEFKTPIATISLAVDALKNDRVTSDKEKMNYFSGIIKEENQRMNKQVEAILKASQFEKQEADIEMKPIAVHKIINQVVDNFQLQLGEKKGLAEFKLNAADDRILGDEVHFTNLISNLVDNAVKYSRFNAPVHLVISSVNHENKLSLRFSDNGIGMSKETQRRVFEKFYRAHTGNLHNVKGFGLGLSYVKSVTESHHGRIRLESVLGKGTTFYLDFPLNGKHA